MHPLQEKFQITVPAKEEAGEPWVTADSQRFMGRQMAWCPANAIDQDPRKFNLPPPGMELANQWRIDIEQQALVMSGATDVSKDTNPMAFAQGYTKREMKAIDDQYTGEHIEHFYGDAGGFVERNNYLDRE